MVIALVGPAGVSLVTSARVMVVTVPCQVHLLFAELLEFPAVIDVMRVPAMEEAERPVCPPSEGVEVTPCSSGFVGGLVWSPGLGSPRPLLCIHHH